MLGRSIFVVGAMLALCAGCTTQTPTSVWTAPQQALVDTPPGTHTPALGEDWPSVCHLRTQRKRALFFSGGATGSAVLVENRYLVTAAHNVADFPGGISSNGHRIEVRCGVTHVDENTPADTILYRSEIRNGAVSAPRYRYNPLRPSNAFFNDFAFVDLGADFASTQSSQLMILDAAQMSSPFILSGYPGEDYDGNTLYSTHVTPTNLSSSFLDYDFDTRTGNSGGPVFVEAGDDHHVVAIHVTEGRGRVIDAELIADFERWKSTRPE